MSFIGNQKDIRMTAVSDKANGTLRTGFVTINVARTANTNTGSYTDIRANSNTNVLRITGSGITLNPNASPRTLTISTDSDLHVSQNNAITAVNNWTTRTSVLNTLDIHDATWSPELGIFVAIGANPVAVQAMTSPDGIIWTARSVPTTTQWNAVAWSPELGIFVAVASSGALNRAMTSPDGIIWTTSTTPVDNPYFGVIWVKELGLFVAVAGSSGAADVNKHAMTSPDGIIWTARTTANFDLYCVAWSKELGLLVALAQTGNQALSSPDGITWTPHTMPSSAVYGGVAWSPELGVFVGVGNDMVASTDGLTWTQATTYPSGFSQGERVVWVPQFRAFVAISSSGANAVAISFDGNRWTGLLPSTAAGRRGLAWSPELGLALMILTADSPNVLTSRPVGIWAALNISRTHAQVMSQLSWKF